jgi:homoserine kinase
MQIIIPASTSNLGASFDTCGLALSLYLKVTVEARHGPIEVLAVGEGAGSVPRDESNLIARVARFVARCRDHQIPGARLTVESQIPLARGLGSSSSAIIAGISVYEELSGERLSEEEIFGYALNFEGHGDNLAPSLLGGLVIACLVERGERRSLLAVKRAWPDAVKVILAVPDYEMETARMRAALPESVPLGDAIFNLQRTALLQSVLSDGRLDLMSEALRDRLHQPYRAPLGPGLNEVLQLGEETHRHTGLLGVAISGAGSTVAAFATDNFEAIADEMTRRFAAAGVTSRAIQVSVDNRGRIIKKG